ncbi:MAG: sugar-binding protein [Lacipirellulaceae bacterium]
MRAYTEISAFALLAVALMADDARGQVRSYDIRLAPSAPTADGVVTPGEWDAAAPAAGNWTELQQIEGDADTAGNRFRMMWDSQALYLLYQTNQNAWTAPPAAANPLFSFETDQLFVYLDPNLDNEQNFRTNPDEAPDAYELAFNLHSGNRVATNANRNGIGVSTEARVDTMFGDQADWNRGGASLAGAAMQGIVVAQNNGASGGVAEVRIPWSALNANATYRGPNPLGDYTADGFVNAADYTAWRDALGSSVSVPGNGADGSGNGVIDQADYTAWQSAYGARGIVETGLSHTFAPTAGDTWFFNLGRVAPADLANYQPVYNWTESFFFAARPHAEVTFVGAGPGTAIPEPGAGLLGGTMLVVAIASRGRRSSR